MAKTLLDFQLHLVDSETGGHLKLSADDIADFEIELSRLEIETSPNNPMVYPPYLTIDRREYTLTMRLKQMPIMFYP